LRQDGNFGLLSGVHPDPGTDAAKLKFPALSLQKNAETRTGQPPLSTVTVAQVTSTIRGAPSEVVLNEKDGMKSLAQ